MHIGSGGEKERGRRRVFTRTSGSPESSRRGRRSEERKSGGAMVLGGRRTERMETGNVGDPVRPATIPSAWR